MLRLQRRLKFTHVSTAQELLSLKVILAELNNHPVLNRPNLYVDNQACIKLSKQTSHHSKTKHFAINVHYLRDICDSVELKLEYVPTGKQPADILTKSLGKNKTRNSGNILVAKDKGNIRKAGVLAYFFSNVRSHTSKQIRLFWTQVNTDSTSIRE